MEFTWRKRDDGGETRGKCYPVKKGWHSCRSSKKLPLRLEMWPGRSLHGLGEKDDGTIYESKNLRVSLPALTQQDKFKGKSGIWTRRHRFYKIVESFMARGELKEKKLRGDVNYGGWGESNGILVAGTSQTTQVCSRRRPWRLEWHMICAHESIGERGRHWRWVKGGGGRYSRTQGGWGS